MVRSCSAYGCTTHDTAENGVFFYRIPLRRDKWLLWLNAMRRKNFDPPVHAAICSKHFLGGEKVYIATHIRELLVCDVYFLNISGKKSVDPDSPAYVPFIFEFSSSLNKRRAEISMTRYEAAKRECKCNDEKATESSICNIHDNLDEECLNPVTVQCDTGETGSCSVEVKTDLTMNDLAALEHDCQQRLNEVYTHTQRMNKHVH